MAIIEQPFHGTVKDADIRALGGPVVGGTWQTQRMICNACETKRWTDCDAASGLPCRNCKHFSKPNQATCSANKKSWLEIFLHEARVRFKETGSPRLAKPCHRDSQSMRNVPAHWVGRKMDVAPPALPPKIQQNVFEAFGYRMPPEQKEKSGSKAAPAPPHHRQPMLQFPREVTPEDPRQETPPYYRRQMMTQNNRRITPQGPRQATNQFNREATPQFSAPSQYSPPPQSHYAPPPGPHHAPPMPMPFFPPAYPHPASYGYGYGGDTGGHYGGWNYPHPAYGYPSIPHAVGYVPPMYGFHANPYSYPPAFNQCHGQPHGLPMEQPSSDTASYHFESDPLAGPASNSSPAVEEPTPASLQDPVPVLGKRLRDEVDESEPDEDESPERKRGTMADKPERSIEANTAEANGGRLYIGNLAYATTEEELKEFFKDYRVETTRVPTNPRTNRPVGYAFVDVSTPSEAERAVTKLDGKSILDRKVSIQLARKPEPATEAGQDKEVALDHIPSCAVELVKAEPVDSRAQSEAPKADIGADPNPPLGVHSTSAPPL